MSGKTYWQVASGSAQRNYPNIFIEFGVFAVNHDWRNTGHYHHSLQKAKRGDIFILKGGISRIHAVGIVQDDDLRKADYYFNLDGWALEYYKFIDWYVPQNPIPAKGKGLRMGTIQKIHVHGLKTLADNALSTWSKAVSSRTINEDIKIVEDKDIINRLIKEGLKIQQSEVLTSTFNRVRLLADYYLKNFDWRNINEDQVRTFLVIPFLLAMGWSEQQLFLEYKIGRKKADIVCFDKPIHSSEKKAKILIEVKKLSEGLNYAIDQAFAYAKALGDVKTICVTNGFCYQIYDLDYSEDYNEPYAYINILEPIDQFPLNNQTNGAIEALIKMLKL